MPLSLRLICYRCMIKHYTIPVFIPELACPFRCAFCNQEKISGHRHIPEESEIRSIVDSYLKSFKQPERHVEIGFFGGTFTGIPLEEQERYLKTVVPYLKSGLINGIRLSTRPDYINKEVLDLLKKYGVTTIELGAQSLDDEVLKASYRGHTAERVAAASKAILDYGFDLGLQMMIGLPGDTFEKSMTTAEKIIALGASNTRIYPALVIKDTAMHRWYKQGRYHPLSLDEAVEWSKHLLLLFEKNNVAVIRMGLHPSEGLVDGSELVAGPFHPSFRELVLTEIWGDILKPLTDKIAEKENIVIKVNPSQLNYATGYSGKNRKRLLQNFNSVKIIASSKIKGRDFIVEHAKISTIG